MKDWKNIFLTVFALLSCGLGWGQITISTSVTSISGYQSTFVGTGNSVDVNSRTITVDGVLTLNNGANLVLEEGWTLNVHDFIIDIGVPSTTPADIEDLSEYTFAMKQGSRLNITAVSESNRVQGGRVYIDAATITYTQTSGQYQFGSFDISHSTFYYIKALTLLSNDAGRLLLQFNRATGDSIFEKASFLGAGRIDFNAIWGIDTSNVNAQSRYPTEIGIVYQLSNEDKVGGEDGNNWTYFRDWIFEDHGVANAPSFVPRSNVNVSFIDPDIQGNQAIRLGLTQNFPNSWMDIRRTFAPKFVDENNNPLNGTKVLIESANASFRWFIGGGRTTGSGEKAGRFITDYDNVTLAVSGTDGFLDNAEKKAYYRVGHRTTNDGDGGVAVYSEIPTAYFYLYGKQIASLGLNNNSRVELAIALLDDTNISQTDKSIVDAYNEIETLDKLYDRSVAWKVDNAADAYPAADSQLATISDAAIDLGSQNLVVDASASQAFVVDTSTNTITIKASTFTAENKFSTITTTGGVSVVNGASIELGYQDSSGKNIYIDFDWGTSDEYDIKIINLNDNTQIGSTYNDQTQRFMETFVAPSPFGSGVKIQLLNTNDNSDVFYEANFTDESALSFVRTTGSIYDISTETTGVAQHEALFLARKILQKTESMAAALEGTTPTLADDTTTITEASSTVATKENQEAIRALLLRILTKTSASYEALKGAE